MFVWVALGRGCQISKDTIWAEMITEMRGASLIVFRMDLIRNIRNLMRV